MRGLFIRAVCPNRHWAGAACKAALGQASFAFWGAQVRVAGIGVVAVFRRKCVDGAGGEAGLCTGVAGFFWAGW